MLKENVSINYYRDYYMFIQASVALILIIFHGLDFVFAKS